LALPAIFLGFLALEDGTDRLSRNVGTELSYTLRNIPEMRRSYLYRGGSLKSHISGYLVLICTATSTTGCHRLFLDQPFLCVRIIYVSLPKINISQVYNVRTGLAILDSQEGHTISKDWPDGCTCVYMYRKGEGGGVLN